MGGLDTLRADGGATGNGFLMQLQADLLGVPVEVAREKEMTALGAAGLAGLALGVWGSKEELAETWRAGARYEPRRDASQLREGWRDALARTIYQ
jgi:glycerol kinase